MNKILDIYVIKNSGIALFSGCTGSAYCMANMHQHELQAGLIAAMHSFATEVFNNEHLNAIIFDNIQLNILYNTKYQILFGLIHERKIKEKQVKNNLIKLEQAFIHTFEKELAQKNFEYNTFESFRPVLETIGISGLSDSMGFQLSANITGKAKLKGWLSKIKETLS